jgi:predicted Fe-Mo cluster-binding NifX family protein
MEKYLVASSGDTLDSKVSGRFGHASHFLIIDPLTSQFEVLPGIQADESGQNINHLMKPEIKKVIVGNIGPSTFKELVSFGCTVYLCRNMTVGQAVEKVKNGTIDPLKQPTLKDSIHSARRTLDNTPGDQGTGRGMGKGHGKRMGGKGRGLGRGMGRGMGGRK